MTGHPWTEAEDEAIRELYATHSADEIAAQLGRTRGAVFQRAHNLGLKIQVEHVAPKFINKKREQKNKPPIFSYRTLHISIDHEKSYCRNGEKVRAGPRLHMRRGHIRCLSDGRRIWVRNAIVGDKAKGFVHKDYAVRSPKSTERG